MSTGPTRPPMSDTTETSSDRPKPPPLEARAPDCSLCGVETSYDDGFVCESCEAYWPVDFHLHDHGEWHDPGEEQCGATTRPWADSVHDILRDKAYRCWLAVGHAGEHAGVDQTGDVIQWKPKRERVSS